MKRKTILLIFILLLTTGCSVNYDLVVEDENITEITSFTQEENATYTKSYMQSLYEEEYPIFYDEEFLYYAPNKKVDGNTYYKKSIIDDGDGYTATYRAEYNINDYQRSRLLNTAYELYSVGYDNDNNNYYLIANNLKIFKNNNDISNITVSITLKDYEVIDGNYDSKSNNTYIWNFDRKSTGNINLKYRKKAEKLVENDNNVKKKKKKSIINGTSSYTIYVFSFILIIIILFSYYIFNKLKEKNNGMDD